MTERLAPPKAANKLSKLMEVFCATHGLERFPVDVEHLALHAHEVFGWKDRISTVKAADIPGFEGCLYPSEDKTHWMLLYNNALTSKGRIRFTQAHELGHYILHRLTRGAINCTEEDMVTWSKKEDDLEGQADLFASYLLMPLDDYRKQFNGGVNLNVFIDCAKRYGVSLSAAILKWLEYTEEKALIIYSTDGFMNWAWSSEPAFHAGAFFKTKNRTVELPRGSLASDESVRDERAGRNVAATVWFPHVEAGMPLCEMKLVAERLGSVITVLRLPAAASAWQPRDFENR